MWRHGLYSQRRRREIWLERWNWPAVLRPRGWATHYELMAFIEEPLLGPCYWADAWSRARLTGLEDHLYARRRGKGQESS